MLEILIILALGGVGFLTIKWLIFRKPFPYPLSIAEQHSLGKTLTKLSDAFEAVEQTRRLHHTGIGDLIECLPISQQASFIADLETSAQSLGRFDPEVVTYVALGHIKTSMSLGRVIRAQAQSQMLHALQTDGLAVSANVFA